MESVYKVMWNDGTPGIIRGIKTEFEGVPIVIYKFPGTPPRADSLHVDVFPNTWWSTKQYAVDDFLKMRKQTMGEIFRNLESHLKSLL